MSVLNCINKKNKRKKEGVIPYKIEPHDAQQKKSFKKMDEITPFHVERMRKFRSSATWQKVVALQKKRFSMCCDPFNDHSNENTARPMDEVHHVKMLSTHWSLRCYVKNLRSICTKCHSQVSQLERQGKPTYHLFKTMPSY